MNDLQVDHVGVVVRDIQQHYNTHFKHLFADCTLGPIIHDELQDVRVAFIELQGGRIELVEPASDDSPVSAMLEKRAANLYHVCFKVADLDEKLANCKKSGMVIVSEAKPAKAFDGRRIAFVMGRDRMLWEFVEVVSK